MLRRETSGPKQDIKVEQDRKRQDENRLAMANVYGDNNEVILSYSNSLVPERIEQSLSSQFVGNLVIDGYAAYARFTASRKDITYAQCRA